MSYSCPYCKGELSPPTRKKSCPHCTKIIFARTRPNKPRGWVRQEDLLAISKEWAHQSLNRCAQWVAQLKYDGFTYNDFTHAKNILQKRFKGKEPNIRDVVWYLFNQLAIKQAMTGNAPAYYMMALFVDEERKIHFHYLRQIVVIHLQMWKRSSHVKTVKICTGGDKACEKLSRIRGCHFWYR